MARHSLLFLTFFWSLTSCGQLPETKVFPCRLGNTTLTVERTEWQGSDTLFLLHVHDNEATARQAAATALDSLGGSLLSLRNKEQRLIAFRLGGASYVADPNRIFSAAGRKASLEKGGRYTPSADEALAGFAAFFLSNIPASGTLISMHNNTEGNYSISSYLPGGELEEDAAEVHVNDSLDADDFYLTTDLRIFSALREKGRNVVLQHNVRAADDGSLSVYFGLQNRPYVNIEAEHGHLEVQVEMLRLLVQILGGDGFENEAK